MVEGVNGVMREAKPWCLDYLQEKLLRWVAQGTTIVMNLIAATSDYSRVQKVNKADDSEGERYRGAQATF